MRDSGNISHMLKAIRKKKRSKKLFFKGALASQSRKKKETEKTAADSVIILTCDVSVKNSIIVFRRTMKIFERVEVNTFNWIILDS